MATGLLAFKSTTILSNGGLKVARKMGTLAKMISMLSTNDKFFR
jgi:hypothetical protein